MVIRPLFGAPSWDIGDGVRRVHHQVEDGLIELGRQATDRGQVRVEFSDRVGDILPLVPRNRERALDGMIQVDGLHFGRPRMRKLLHGAHDGSHALDAFARLLNGSRNLPVQIFEIRVVLCLANLLYLLRQQAGCLRRRRQGLIASQHAV